MFLVEETISVMNVLYQNELDSWLKKHFSENRLGDKIDHTKHLVMKEYNLENITEEYYQLLQEKNLSSLVSENWKENPKDIEFLVTRIKTFDEIRKQDFTKTFPEVAECYARYL
jgi:DNA-binding transcriptional regulator PaaX